MDLPSGKLRKQEEEAKPGAPPATDRGISKWKLALGAASLFFFVVGVKRSFRTEDGREIRQSDADLLDAEREQAKPANRSTSPANTSGKSAPRSRAEAGVRSARGGRLGALLEKAEKNTRFSRDAVRGRTGDKDASSSRTRRRDTRSPRKRSR